MSVLISKETSVICQGLTGSRWTLHSESDVDVIAADVLKDGTEKILNAVKG